VKKIVKTFFIIVGLAVVYVLALELSVRIFYPQPFFSFFMYSSHLWEKGDDHWLTRKNGIEFSKRLGFKCRMDVFDRKRDPKKKQGVYRILIFGDSVTVHGFPHYPANLELLLNGGSPEGAYEVWNLAVPTYNTFQEKELFDLEGLKLKPDMIMVGFCLNDFEPGCVAMRKDGKIVLCQLQDDVWLEVSPFLFNNSHLYRLVISNLMRQKASKLSNRERSACPEAAQYRMLNPRYYSLVSESLRYFRDVSRGNGIPFVLLVFPALKDEKNCSEYGREAYAAILEICKRLNIDYIDFTPYFKKSGDWEKFRYLDRKDDYLHFNNTGHKLVAEVLYAYVDSVKRGHQ